MRLTEYKIDTHKSYGWAAHTKQLTQAHCANELHTRTKSIERAYKGWPHAGYDFNFIHTIAAHTISIHRRQLDERSVRLSFITAVFIVRLSRRNADATIHLSSCAENQPNSTRFRKVSVPRTGLLVFRGIWWFRIEFATDSGQLFVAWKKVDFHIKCWLYSSSAEFNFVDSHYCFVAHFNRVTHILCGCLF